jgi:general secretion pathway protein G
LENKEVKLPFKKGVKMRARNGFTLVEILIVMVILGIIAAILIPQFSSASEEARESVLISELQTIRSQIELYKLQHNGNLPGQDDSGDFVTAMTTSTDRDGKQGGRFGPYLQKIPDNPFSVAAAGPASVGTGAAKKDPAQVGDDGTGWWFVTSGPDAGLFQANDNMSNELVDPAIPHTAY